MRRYAAWPKTGAEWWLLVRVLVLLLAVRILVPCVPFHTLLALLGQPKRGRHMDPSALRAAARYADALIRRLHFPQPGPCLPRSLVLCYLARRGGLPVDLNFGVRRGQHGLQWHTWLTLDGVPFLEAGEPARHFATLYSSLATQGWKHDPLDL